MGRNVWDNMHEGPTSDGGMDEAATHVRDPSHPGMPPERRHAALPWLLFLLALVGLGALVGRDLDRGVRAKRELQSARDEAAELRHQLFAVQAKLSQAQSERDQASQKSSTLAAEVAARTAEKQADDKLIGDLKAKLDTHDGDVSRDANQIRVNLVDQILFKSGDANISPRGKKVLDKVGTVLKKLTDKQILVGGHTDDRPIHTAQFPSNWELSAARAVNVVRYLSEVVGVSPDKLTAAGFSQFHPRSKTSKAKNRRIEILLTPVLKK